MSDMVITARPMVVSEATHRFPLGTETGIAVVLALVNADNIWSTCTPKQRELIAELCQPAIMTAIQTGGLTAAQLPPLPEWVERRPRESLERKGLAKDGRLTPVAVYAAYWIAWREHGEAA